MADDLDSGRNKNDGVSDFQKALTEAKNAMFGAAATYGRKAGKDANSSGLLGG